MKSSEKQGMTQPEKPLIKLRAQSDLGILAGPRSIGVSNEGNPEAIIFPRAKIADNVI